MQRQDFVMLVVIAQHGESTKYDDIQVRMSDKRLSKQCGIISRGKKGCRKYNDNADERNNEQQQEENVIWMKLRTIEMLIKK